MNRHKRVETIQAAIRNLEATVAELYRRVDNNHDDIQTTAERVDNLNTLLNKLITQKQATNPKTINNCHCDTCTPGPDKWDNEHNQHLFTPARHAQAITNLSGYAANIEQHLAGRIDEQDNQIRNLQNQTAQLQKQHKIDTIKTKTIQWVDIENTDAKISYLTDRIEKLEQHTKTTNQPPTNTNNPQPPPPNKDR